jgi:hypothetical protein
MTRRVTLSQNAPALGSYDARLGLRGAPLLRGTERASRLGANMNYITADSAAAGRRVPVDWTALESAFDGNAQGVRCYLHLKTGAVARVVAGLRDPDVCAYIAEDSDCVPIDAISNREQYRWLEAFIVTVDDVELRQRLMESIQGQGSFRRFKGALLLRPEQLRRWRAFRRDRIRIAIIQWFHARGLIPVPYEQPSLGATESARQRFYSATSALPSPDLHVLTSLAKFLRARRSVRQLPGKLSAKDA